MGCEVYVSVVRCGAWCDCVGITECCIVWFTDRRSEWFVILIHLLQFLLFSESE